MQCNTKKRFHTSLVSSLESMHVYDPLDRIKAAGYMPGGALAVAGAQIGVGVLSTVNSAADRDVNGALTGIAGIQLTPIAPALEEAGVSGAKVVPIAGAVVSARGPKGDRVRRDKPACCRG